MDTQQAYEVATKYAEKVAKEFKPMEIILFGSYANGKPTDDSDIDIAVVFDKYNGDWWDGSARLHSLCWDVDTTIEPHLLEVINDRSGFVSHVRQHGKRLYPIINR